MIDAALLPPLHAVLNAPARALVTRGVKADQVTLAGFCIGLLALPALWLGMFGVALVLILLNRLADGLDGIMARQVGESDRGAFLDIALDFVFYATVPLGFAVSDPQNALAAAVLITAFVGTGSSFLAFAVIAAKRGMRAEDHAAKGIFYLGGLTEGAETIAFFILICLWPGLFVPLAYIFAMACAVTTLMRWRQGWRVFSGP
ncbi:CDP-alcohol phosphatidyltransferase family protein [Pseudorhodobacter sp.]|uniref:CDP-alcohol phosphatidyltransferase family protein n=1 Tax=Pseudorhodobacter sp. TaxID=1934400 RepID=UPI002648FFE6|nr:CDP-alcohol phosphatidyltransferase family protein [Pseudorhodobacter sp.]MDN5788464.1 CDP-alcohol phosphatidyltransferase family protein [Pseudorhodobacter sp.]